MFVTADDLTVVELGAIDDARRKYQPLGSRHLDRRRDAAEPRAFAEQEPGQYPVLPDRHRPRRGVNQQLAAVVRIEIVAQSDLPISDRGRYLLFAEMQLEGGIALFRKIGKVPLRPV